MSIRAQLVRRRENVPALSEAARAGEGVGEEAIPEGVPVRSMAEEEEEPAESVCWCLSICLGVGQAWEREKSAQNVVDGEQESSDMGSGRR